MPISQNPIHFTTIQSSHPKLKQILPNLLSFVLGARRLILYLFERFELVLDLGGRGGSKEKGRESWGRGERREREERKSGMRKRNFFVF